MKILPAIFFQESLHRFQPLIATGAAVVAKTTAIVAYPGVFFCLSL